MHKIIILFQHFNIFCNKKFQLQWNSINAAHVLEKLAFKLLCSCILGRDFPLEVVSDSLTKPKQLINWISLSLKKMKSKFSH